MIDNPIIKLLFETKAMEVCDADKPFFYTSGKLGPYYINTHYLYGSKADADGLLNVMDLYDGSLCDLPGILESHIMKQINCNNTFRSTIEILTKKASELDFDFISGGERRDFFFSIPVAVMLNKPHLSIFKNGSVCLSTSSFAKSKPESEIDLTGHKALHIADLITEASSYVRAWIPAITRLGANISESLAVIDRNQGGKEVLENTGIAFNSLANISDDFFNAAFEQNFISAEQLDLIKSFINNPDKFMLDFFAKNPDFLNEQINAGGKSKERALRCIENRYHLPTGKV